MEGPMPAEQDQENIYLRRGVALLEWLVIGVKTMCVCNSNVRSN